MKEQVEFAEDGMIKLQKPVAMPDILDMLIIGGGPAGTAAAFRAKELGLSALVVDFDDILKRIRDYAKNKPILPDFGGGDKMKFPRAGDLISLLCFTEIDKDDMHVLWKQFYAEHEIPAQIGIEVTRLESVEDIWHVSSWNHLTKKDVLFKARHVVVAVGRGVPRRFDIPGNTEGIGYRLDDAAAYVKEPALVIGGGTSAAEAVIAISNAKTKAKSKTSVYWSYRGRSMPKVSRALAPEFFEAYVGNGNIHYYPESEPVAVVTGDDKREYLAIRVDRKLFIDRPHELSMLEFPKEACLACIGEDIPESLLLSWGIRMATGGPKNKKRMVVTPLLETQQRNVYMVGDILSQAYLMTEDFDADPAGFEEVKHRGNIKAALVDGVYVTEVIAQRLSGITEISVELQFVEDTLDPKVDVTKGPAETVVIERDGPPEGSQIAEREVEEAAAYLIRMLAGNVEEDEYAILPEKTLTIGRAGCDLTYADDSLLSPRHASIAHGPDGLVLRDDGSINGVYVRAAPGKYCDITANHLIRVGRQFLRITALDSGWQLCHFNGKGEEVARHTLADGTSVAGRQAPDIVLDKEDMTLSRRHLAILVRPDGVAIKDLGSANGTLIKIHRAHRVQDGDQIRMGHQVFNLVIRETVSLAEVVNTRRQAVTEPPKPPPAKADVSEAQITFAGTGKACSFEPGDTICDIADANDIPLNAECHAGICGTDPIKVVKGSENLNPLTDAERETLEDICDLDPAECRLACMVRPKGPAEIEILET